MGNEFDYIMSISETLSAGKWIAVVQKDIIEGNSRRKSSNKQEKSIPRKNPS